MSYQRVMPIQAGEEGFKKGLVELIRRTQVCPEVSVSLAYEVYKEDFELPVDAVFAQLGD